MINLIVDPPTMCHPDERAVPELRDNDWLHKYTKLIYLETCDKTCNIQYTVNLVTSKRTSA